jgi:hypothetical protein
VKRIKINDIGEGAKNREEDERRGGGGGGGGEVEKSRSTRKEMEQK